MHTFSLERDDVLLGGALRRAAPHLLAAGKLRYDPVRKAGLNDLVFGEIIQTPARSFKQLTHNRLERLYPHSSGVRITTESFQKGPCIAVVGNRYAPPYVIGGLDHPITGRPNGELRGGVIADSLFGLNAVGFINRDMDPEARVRIQIKGVLVDADRQPIKLTCFREVLPDSAMNIEHHARLIVVTGRSTDAGKTTCAWALVSALRARGFNVTLEKKTGTACCKDWLRCFMDPADNILEEENAEFSFHIEQFPARDFVDGLGIASDVSLDVPTFVKGSVQYTRDFVARFRPDFHVIELADSIAHVSNAMLLRSEYFRLQPMVLVYSGVSSYEAAAHLTAYAKTLGHGRTPLVLSGPLANESRFAIARDEIEARLRVPVCRSAFDKDGRWVPEGSELAGAVLSHFDGAAARRLG